jgi:hypothetical protein
VIKDQGAPARSSRERLIICSVLAIVLLAGAVGMWPDLAASRVDLNDNVLHFAMIERIVQTVERGGNPLDIWSPEWTFGFPVLRVYQPLAHLLTAGVYFLLGKTVPLMTVFVWMRFLAVLLLPISFYASARLLRFPAPTALAAAVLCPLISSTGLFGLEYGSYVWAGNGLFTQAVAAHLFLLSLGLGYRAIREGKGIAAAGVLLGLTFLAHLIFGYMGAISLCLLAVLPDAKTARADRIVRTVRLGAIAIAISAFQLLPLLIDGPILNHSRWEPVWKWDGFGWASVLRYLFTGALLDANRFPVLSLAALGGVIVHFRIARSEAHRAERFVFYGALFWLAMLAGRPLWGPALSLLGVSADMQLHRVAAGAQVFLVLLAAVCFGELWRWRGVGVTAAAVGLSLAAIVPAIRERADYLENNRRFGAENLAAYQLAKPALDATIGLLKQRSGRVYAGVPAEWGGQHKIGSVPFFAFLSTSQIPAVAYLYHAMALPAEIQPRMNEWNPEHYRLFGIHTVVVPAGIQTPLPPFWVREQTIGRFDVFTLPGNGYFDVVDAPAAVHTTKHNFYDINDRWLQSDWASKHLHLLLDLGGPVPDKLRLWPEDPLPALPAFDPPGRVLAERGADENWTAEIDVSRASFALFKMTWHANWHAWVDNAPARVSMLSPGFIGVPVTPGRHTVRLQYQGSAWKLWLALGGICIAFLLARAPKPALHVSPRMLAPAALVLLALPVAIPLLTGRLATGDDALGYLPRQIEFHKDVAEGALVPRWAPDLDRGAGQPTFLFVPPLLHYVAEVWQLTGMELQKAINFAIATLVILFGVAMFLLGRLYFGTLGGYLCAAAALYAPYISLDLYARAAWSEFSAFPFCALALYGFGAFGRNARSPYLALGAASYAAVVLSHFLVALHFTPLLLAFLFFTVARERWPHAAIGLAAAIGLSAWVWVPIAFERQYVQLEKTMQDSFRYSYHLLHVDQLLGTEWGYGAVKSFAVGWGLIVLAAAAWIGRGDRRLLRFFSGAAAVFCLLTLQWAGPVWEWVTVLQQLQFPWRLLGGASICLAVAAASLGPVIERLGRWRWPAFVAAMTIAVVPNLYHLAPGAYRDLDAHLWTPGYLAISGFETTTSGELRPKWMREAPPYPLEARIVAGEGAIRSDSVHIRTPARIELPVAYFPGWEVKVDGVKTAIYPGPKTGLIRFAVNPGDHRIEMQWTRTAPQLAGEVISILSVGMNAVALVVDHRRRRV